MNDQEIISMLRKYGHLDAPFGEKRSVTIPTNQLQLTDQVVRDAVESYQAFHQEPLSPIIAAFYPKRTSAAVKIDGLIGPATHALLQQPRCECADYSFNEPEELQGSGNWKGCHNIGNFHCAIMKFITPIPPHLTAVWPQIWQEFVDSYANIGLLWKLDDAQTPNTEVSFVNPDGNWIGLAIVGVNQSCSSKIWINLDKNYSPANLIRDYGTLLRHEAGHNCGLQHSNGGTMNPYIMAVESRNWVGDPSEPLLKRMFGGQPIPSTPTKRKMVLAWKNENGTYKDILDVDTSGDKQWWPE